MEQKEDKIQWGQTQYSFVSEQTIENADDTMQVSEMEYTASSEEEAVISLMENKESEVFDASKEIFLQENKENLVETSMNIKENFIMREDTKQDSEEFVSKKFSNSNRKLFTMHKAVASDEDAPPISEDGIIIVCDGLGAAGQNPHKYGEEIRTSAYIGSRCVSKATYEFFTQEVIDSLKEDEETIQNMMRCFKNYLSERLEQCIVENQLQKTIKGKSSELLPTTLAMAIYKEDYNAIDVLTIWAGDSRLYLLSPDYGLQQLSEDDTVEEYDAMKALGTSNMCNSISGEGKDAFVLNYRFHKIEKRQNLFLFATTDGSFDYLPTPMYFEGVLESAIGRMPDSADLSQYGESLGYFYQGNYLNDDTTIAGVIFTPSDVTTLKEDYAKRYERVERLYNNPTIDYMKKKMIAEEEASKRLTPVNKKMKIVGNDLKKEIITVLKSEYPENCDAFEFRYRLLNLPCMTEYGKKELFNRKEIKTLEDNIISKEKEKSSEEAELERFFDSVFMEQYMQQWRSTKRVETELDRLVQQYLGYREDLERKIKIVDNNRMDLRNMLDEGFDEKDVLSWARKVYGKADDMLKKAEEENKARKDISINEKTTRGKIYQEITRQKATDEKIGKNYWEKFKSMRQKRFSGCEKHEDYIKMVNLLKNIELLEQEINKSKEEKRKKKQKEFDYEPIIRSLGNTLVIEFIQDTECLNYLEDGLRGEVIELKTLYEEQKAYKEEAERLHQEIFALWKFYKFVYELYRIPRFGGTV